MNKEPYKYVYRNKYLRAWVDENLLLLYSEWLRSVSSEEYRAGTLALAGIIQEKGIKYWISEASMLGDISHDDQLWVVNTLTPMLSVSAIRKIARINSSNIATFLGVETAAELLGSSMQLPEMQQFWSFKDAADWMAGIKPD